MLHYRWGANFAIKASMFDFTFLSKILLMLVILIKFQLVGSTLSGSDGHEQNISIPINPYKNEKSLSGSAGFKNQGISIRESRTSLGFLHSF